MTIKNIEEKVSKVVIPKTPNFEFIYDLLLAYGKPQPSITRLKKGTYNLSDDKNTEIYWKNNLLFRYVQHFDLHETIDDLKRSPYGTKYNPRFVMVTDFEQLLAVDTRTEETLDIPITDLASHYAFFLPWSGMEKSQLKIENEADVKAAEKMAKLYDEIITIEENALLDPTFLHSLNIFFSRLLFCFFAEDTEVFKKGQFTSSISSHTQLDGSDLHSYLDELFAALDVENKTHGYPTHVAEFPYVNGGLFNKPTPAPKFNTKARRLIIECGADLNWSEINPDIFGSMIQAVVHPGQRAGLGMHYTSVVNIMKVIDPLFIEELKEELDHAFGDRKKLEKLLNRIYGIKVFDPACGSGNFLIIAYKELRKIEHEILEQLLEGKLALRLSTGLKLENFYGIEIDDFAREVAVLSLWLAKHQMNIEFKKKFGKDLPLIPLKDTGNVICANAATHNWEEACPVNDNDELYLIGNPPYLGSRNQKKEHKADKDEVLTSIRSYKNLDYIAIWFYKGSKMILNRGKCKLAFVTTNSITQGDQVAIFWPIILKNLEIGFAHTSFKWTNNAKKNAGVSVVVISLQNKSTQSKTLYEGIMSKKVPNINAYLTAGPDVYIGRRSKPLGRLPTMLYGNEPRENGNLLLNDKDREELLKTDPDTKNFIKKITGSNEYINSINRWCLWISDSMVSEASRNPFIKSRLEKVSSYRVTSDRKDTQKLAAQPHRFTSITYKEKQCILVPIVFSERREYLLAGYVESDTVVLNSAQVIYDSKPYVFGLISSKLHMLWVKSVAGQLETRVRYSSVIAYNNFPVPPLSEKQLKMIENNVFEVLDARERHTEKTLGELYDPETMPEDLRKAHADLDEVIESCYRVRPFDNDEDRLSYLFKLYEITTHKQKELI